MDEDATPGTAPLVSAIIPAYNAEAVIADAIESVLAQDYSPVEIVVVNDFSTDGTADVVGRYADRGVRLINLPRNCGASACRNEGIAAATGPFIAFLDADDEWMPGKLTAQVADFLAAPGCSLSVCDGKWVDPENNVIDTGLAEAPEADDGNAWQMMLSRSFIHTSCVLTTKALLEKLGGFDPSLVVAEDWDLWIRLGLEGPYAFTREMLATVHVTPGSLMKREAKNMAGYLLPMIAGHLKAQKSRLSAAERRRIWCVQLERVGRATCEYGSYLEGATILMRALVRGHVTWAAIHSLICNFPLVRMLGGGGRSVTALETGGRRARPAHAIPADDGGVVVHPGQRFQAIETLVPAEGRAFIEVTNAEPLFREWARNSYDRCYTCTTGEAPPNGRFDCVVFSDFSMSRKINIAAVIQSYVMLLDDDGVLVFAVNNVFDKNNLMKLLNPRSAFSAIKAIYRTIFLNRYLKLDSYKKYAATFKAGDLYGLVSVSMPLSKSFYGNINIGNDYLVWLVSHPLRAAIYRLGINGYLEPFHIYVVRK